MRKLFVSYARENKADVDQLVEHLRLMGYETWADTALRGGQDWWDEILARIADTDVMIAIYSAAALDSTACAREFEWATALGKPLLPVAVEPPPTALPSRFARRQIIDYSQPAERDRAALQLQGALATLPPAPPVPDPLPEAPKAPLSYLTDIIDLVSQPDPIDHEQQHQILLQLEPALTSLDPLERRGGRDILERFSTRRELYADVDRAISRLKLIGEALPVADSASSTPTATTAPDQSAGDIASAPAPAVPAAVEEHPPTDVPPASSPEPAPPTTRSPSRLRSRRTVIAVVAGAVVLLVAAVVVVLTFSGHSSNSSRASKSSPSGPTQTDVLPWGSIKMPGGLAVDAGGAIYVTEPNERQVVKQAAGQDSITTLPFTLTDQQMPYAVAVDPAGNVYLVESGGDQILKLAGGSNLQTELPSTGGAPGEMAVDGAGDLYVISGGNVVKLAAGTMAQTVLPFTGPNRPESLAVNSAGDVYVAEMDQVVKLAAGASAQTVLPLPGLKPSSMAVDNAGNIYLLNGTAVLKVAAGSTTATTAPITGLQDPGPIAADGTGNVYVADYSPASETGRVVKLSVG